MRGIAARQANERLKRAREAVQQLADAKGHAETDRAWSEFLLAANTVFSKLEQGSKISGTSRGWYGRIKHLRKTDELLTYIHHARNADEHGLESSVRMQAPQLEEVAPDYVPPPDRRGKEVITRLPWGKRLKLTFNNGSELVAVSDERYGDRFDLPFTHMGKRLTGGSISEFAALACDTLEGFISEAKELISDQDEAHVKAQPHVPDS